MTKLHCCAQWGFPKCLITLQCLSQESRPGLVSGFHILSKMSRTAEMQPKRLYFPVKSAVPTSAHPCSSFWEIKASTQHPHWSSAASHHLTGIQWHPPASECWKGGQCAAGCRKDRKGPGCTSGKPQAAEETPLHLPQTLPSWVPA